MAIRASAALAWLVVAACATFATACGRSNLDSADPSAPAGASGAAGATPPTPARDASVDAILTTPSATFPDGTCIHNASVVDGTCACPLGAPTICGDACVDVLTDADHCGECAQACGPTSACLAGKCRPAPAVLVSPERNKGCGRIDLAVGSKGLAWTDDTLGTVDYMSIATMDNPMIFRLADGESAPSHPSIMHDTFVLWLDAVRRAIRFTDRSVPTTGTWVASDDEIRGYVGSPDGISVYYSLAPRIRDPLPASIQLKRFGNPTPVAIATFASGQPGALALSGDKLVATVGGAGYIAAITQVPGDIASCDDGINTSLHNCVHLANGDDIDQDLLLIGPDPQPRPVWVEDVSLLAGSLATYGKASLAFGTEPITGLAADRTWIYYATTSQAFGSANGVIYRVATPPGQVGGAIARGQLAPRSLATDGTHLFWSTADCAINVLDL